jgi:trehalose 2-sulfotransferase
MTFAACILCATPRSGSTLLCDMLADAGKAGRPQSYYRRQGIAHWAGQWGLAADQANFAAAYLAAVKLAGTSENGIFGLRIMWETLAELSGTLAHLYPQLPTDAARFDAAFGEALYVHLSRRDKVAQAVSWLRAEQSGVWHRFADGAIREQTGLPAPARYDGARIAALCNNLIADDAAWNNWFSAQDIRPVRLTYEAIASAPREALATILAALGVDTERAAHVEIRAGKLADSTSMNWVQRFRNE